MDASWFNLTTFYAKKTTADLVSQRRKKAFSSSKFFFYTIIQSAPAQHIPIYTFMLTLADPLIFCLPLLSFYDPIHREIQVQK